MPIVMRRYSTLLALRINGGDAGGRAANTIRVGLKVARSLYRVAVVRLPAHCRWTHSLGASGNEPAHRNAYRLLRPRRNAWGRHGRHANSAPGPGNPES